MELICLKQPDEKWDDFVSQYSSLIFHKAVWAKVLFQAYPENKLLYFVLRDKEKWLLAMPAMVLNCKIFYIFHSLIHYGGFIGDKRYISIFLKLLEKEAKKYKFNRIQIIDPEIKEKEQLEQKGFVVGESYRHILTLAGKAEEDIFRGYKSALRGNIKQAIKSGLISEKIKNREDVEEFYRLYLGSMRRNKALAKYPLSFIYAIYDLTLEELADILFVRYDNRVIAGIIVIYSENTAHCVQAGSDSEHLHLRANDFLFHEAIKLSLEKGKKYFDFLGSDKRLLSLIRYKDKFGTKKEELFSFCKDIGIVKPFIWRLVYKLANTSLGARIVNKMKFY